MGSGAGDQAASRTQVDGAGTRDRLFRLIRRSRRPPDSSGRAIRFVLRLSCGCFSTIRVSPGKLRKSASRCARRMGWRRRARRWRGCWKKDSVRLEGEEEECDDGSGVAGEYRYLVNGEVLKWEGERQEVAPIRMCLLPDGLGVDDRCPKSSGSRDCRRVCRWE